MLNMMQQKATTGIPTSSNFEKETVLKSKDCQRF